MEDKVFMFSEKLQVTLPEAYDLVRSKSGLAHVITLSDMAAICTGRPLSGLYAPVEPGPEKVEKKCQRCFMKLPDNWTHYTGSYAGTLKGL